MTVPAYPRGRGNHIDEPEIEQLAHRYSVHPEQLEELLERLRVLETRVRVQHSLLREQVQALGCPLLLRVFDLHGPTLGTRDAYCDGCDTSCEPAEWPCTTWTVIEHEVRTR